MQVMSSEETELHCCSDAGSTASRSRPWPFDSFEVTNWLVVHFEAGVFCLLLLQTVYFLCILL